MMNGFNRGVVFGRLVDAEYKTSTRGTPYMTIKMECPHHKYGNVKVYGQLWGEEKIETLQKMLLEHQKVLKFYGFFKQFKKKNESIVNSYTFYDFMPIDEENEYRATFILRGIIKDLYEDEDGDGCLLLYVRRKTDHEDIEEEFHIFFDVMPDFWKLQVGQAVEVKGVIAEMGEEDYFGGTSGVFKPYCKQVKVLENKEEDSNDEGLA